MTSYIAAYDTESPGCLAGVREIVAKHEKFEMPATFFLVARTLEADRPEYVALLKDHPLFEMACHSYTHMVLRDTPEFGKAGPLELFPREIVDSKKFIEDTFGREVVGFRPPVSSDDGLKAVPEALRLLQVAGYRYVSSLAWGPHFTLPALLVSPFTYAEQGYPELWELPPCGWHENLLKGNNRCGPVRIGLFPPAMPETIPNDYIKTPEEEFQYNNKPFVDKAVADRMTHVSLIWHPWSLHRFDPEMRMLEMTFSYIRERGIPAVTFVGLLQQLLDGKER
ncbi:MAG: polysaccharide deacetylase family protein [Candidatus Hydrogenedentes bacterium]|nr:polysaccharide deacetylase family protein [Candidatus Hydrogenedentota bacterium]